jgi:peptidoglycan hydrolase-like protein with peptidoglycan-binding domain
MIFKKIGLVAVSALMIASPLFAIADTLTRPLQVGSQGTDVSALQSFLAQDATLYPQGLVTGYFGFLTKSAVSNFQSRNGIDPVGRVGPITLPVLNAQMAGGMSNTTIAPSISNISIVRNRTDVSVNWNTNESAKGVVYYSTSPLSTYEQMHSVDGTGAVAMTDANSRMVHSVALSNLQPNTTYYYMIYTTDLNGNVSVTWPASFQTTN